MSRALPSIRTVLIGVVGGVMSGLLGVGGGVIFVPALVLLLGAQQRVAHATSLAAIVPIGIVGAVVYAVAEGVDYVVAAALAAGAVIGAPLGVRALSRLSPSTLRILYAAVAIPVAVRFLVT